LSPVNPGRPADAVWKEDPRAKPPDPAAPAPAPVAASRAAAQDRAVERILARQASRRWWLRLATFTVLVAVIAFLGLEYKDQLVGVATNKGVVRIGGDVPVPLQTVAVEKKTGNQSKMGGRTFMLPAGTYQLHVLGEYAEGPRLLLPPREVVVQRG